MALLMAGSIIATHPKESFEAAKAFGESAYNFTKAGFQATAALTEAAIALGLKGIELVDATEVFAKESDFTEEVEMYGLAPKHVSEHVSDIAAAAWVYYLVAKKQLFVI